MVIKVTKPEIKKLNVVKTDCTNPYQNLAAEEYMTFNAKEGEVAMYLWQNAHTVVIGKNQNPWKECNVEQIKKDNACLARRMSGGGAVYHDMGNLNFTFIARDGLYDIARQTEVILLACRKLGINAMMNGRNDLTVDDKKFSGHAYFSSQGYNYHHGTIMLDVVSSDLPKYLNVSSSKLKSKGVDSVRSRVTNLKEYLPKMSREKMVDEMKDALISAFSREYGLEVTYQKMPDVPTELIEKYTSEEWRLGTKIPFEKDFSHRFEWGEVEVQLSMNGEYIKECKIYSDSLETEVFEIVEKLLTGAKYDAATIKEIKIPAGASATGYEILKMVASNI